MNRAALTGILLCLLAIAACSRGTSSGPVIPQLPENPEITTNSFETAAPGHSLLGYFFIEIDPLAAEATATPLRSTTWHLNTLKFIEPPVGGSLISFSNIAVSGTLVQVDITIQHPFPGMPQFSGFDAKGIVIGPADMADPTDPTLRWGGSLDGLRLLNADGMTRWWNPAEFPYNESVFSYKDGLYGTPASEAGYQATLCGYKVFASALEPDANTL